VITHLCSACGTPVEVARVDVTTVAGGPSFVWGRWERCTGCGSTAEPMRVVDANDRQLGTGQWEGP
jgi:NAD-dependent dihydropyrimidine dehydrogenase PreA subunit